MGRKPIQVSHKAVFEYYKNGHTLMETGEKFGVSHETVRLWLKAAGKARRASGRRGETQAWEKRQTVAKWAPKRRRAKKA